MATDPAWIDNSGGLPSYSGTELRLTTIAPFIVGNGASLGVRSGVRVSGSGTDLLVQAQASPNMTVKVNTGIFVAQGSISATQGAYGWALDTLTNVTVTAAHATLTRTDLIVVRIRDANVDTSGARDGTVTIVTGTAGAGVPALPTDASYFEIARIAVGAAVSTITGANITDKRTFYAAVGGTVPYTTALGLPAGMPAGSRAYNLTTNLYYWNNGTTWLREQVSITKLTDTSYTSNTTLGTDAQLQFPMDANATYVFDMDVGISAHGTPQIQLVFTAPAGTRVDVARNGMVMPGPVAFNDWIINTTTFPGPAGVFAGITANVRFVGTVICGGTPGTFALQHAQSVSSVTTVTACRGSTLTYRQIA